MKTVCEKCKLDSKSRISPIIHRWLCDKCNENLEYDFEALKNEFLNSKDQEDVDDGLFPPPWDFVKYPEKTEGWIEFQKEMRKHPKYYLGKY